jgi:hypothetical protein
MKDLYKEIDKNKEAEEKAKLEKMQTTLRSATAGVNTTPIRNIDPFERKRRIAQ